jgi:mannitol/fructose-specific phosphotransferase system IIA component (Ntr-type)
MRHRTLRRESAHKVRNGHCRSEERSPGSRRSVSDQFTGSSVSSARFETSPDITVNARRTAMHITTLLHERSIALDLDVRTKEEALEALIALLVSSSKVTDAAALRQAVMDREALSTTGIGNGIAIPHAKTDAVTDMMLGLGIMREPIDFHSIDDQPVRIIALLVGMETRVGTYLKLLSRVRRLMNSATFRKRLLQATTPAEAIAAFNEEEDRYFEMA